MRRGTAMSEVWKLIKPLAVYYIGYYVIRMVVGTLLAGGGMSFLMEEGSSIVNGIAMTGGCAVLFPMIGEEREEQKKERERRKREREAQEDGETRDKKSVLRYPALVIFAAASVVFFNILISLSGLMEQSDLYRQTAARQYAVSLGMGLFLYAGVSAVVEEVVFRFLLYNRLRRSGGRAAFGIVASAFLFGVYHGNIVQGLYAFVVLFHGVGNAVIFLGNMIPEVYDIVFSPVMFWVFGLITVAGSMFLVREVRKGLQG